MLPIKQSIFRGITILFSFSAIASVHGLDIVGYGTNPSAFDRFTGGYGVSMTENAGLLQGFGVRGLDLSGVGWTEDLNVSGKDRKSITMISPQHFVAAQHFRPTGTVTFLNQNGVLKTYQIDESSLTRVGLSDLLIGRLTEVIPAEDAIRHYSVWDAGRVNELENEPAYMYGTGLTDSDSPRVGFNEVESVGSGFIRYYQDPVFGQTLTQGGDSGSPTFATFGNELTLVGVRYGAALKYSYDTFVGQHVSTLNGIMDEDGFAVIVAGSGTPPIPEPAQTVWVIGFSALIGVRFWMQRKGGFSSRSVVD